MVEIVACFGFQMLRLSWGATGQDLQEQLSPSWLAWADEPERRNMSGSLAEQRVTAGDGQR